MATQNPETHYITCLRAFALVRAGTVPHVMTDTVEESVAIALGVQDGKGTTDVDSRASYTNRAKELLA